MTRSNTKIVARNFVWYAMEIGANLTAAFLVTVAIARVIGPVRLGYYNYVYWITRTSSGLGSLGMPLATFKYMGEYLGSTERHLARAVFYTCLKVQIWLSIALASVGTAIVLFAGDPRYRIASILLVLNIIPQMITLIPSQANNAAEKFAANTRASVTGIFINVIGVGLSLWLGWDLIGISASVLLAGIVELAAKLWPVLTWTRELPHGEMPPHFGRRLIAFAARSTGMMVLQVVVWDRSDILLLKFLNSDIRQLAFFSVSFSMVERILLIPQALGGAMASTQMAEYGRDKNRLFKMTGTAGTYAFLIASPILLGAACLSGPIVSILYGPKYLPAISVFSVAAVFAIGKAILSPAQTLLYSTEDLGFLLRWIAICGAVNIAIDCLLIPHHGAIGAAIGNGTAQSLAALGIWFRAASRYSLGLQPGKLAKIAGAGCLMTLIVLIISSSNLRGIVKLSLGVPVGAVAFLLSLRLLSALASSDRDRLLLAAQSLPLPARGLLRRFVVFAVPGTNQAEYDTVL